jgi:hypothetical protein
MRFLVLGGTLMLAACGGGTTGTNYSAPPPMATIVATPTPTPSATPEASESASGATTNADMATENAD